MRLFVFFSLVLILFTSSDFVYAAPYSVIFQDASEVTDSLQLSDGGSVVLVNIHKNNDPNEEYVAVLIKLDANGDIQWNHSISAAGSAAATLLLAANDQGFIVVGTSNPAFVISPDLFLIKYSIDGNVLWKRSYGNDGFEVLDAGIEMNDGSIILTGWTTSFNHVSNREAFILRIGPTGNILWARLFDSVYAFSSIQKTFDDKLFVSVTLNSSTSGSIAKMNKNGNFEWVRSFPNGDSAWPGVATKDGSLIGTSTKSTEIDQDIFRFQTFVWKMSPAGIIQKAKEFRMAGNGIGGGTILPANNGGYLFWNGDLLINIDKKWDILWSKAFRRRTTYSEFSPRTIHLTGDGYFVGSDVAFSFGNYAVNWASIKNNGASCGWTKNVSVTRNNAKIQTDVAPNLKSKIVTLKEKAFTFRTQSLSLQTLEVCQ